MLAIEVAQVDTMSNGRVELGLGAGWFDPEHHAHAVPFPPLGQRFEMLEEQLQIVLGMWTTPRGERFTFEGKHYKVVDSPGLPKPAQQPHPPIIIGGARTKRTPRLAARYADEFNVPFHSVADFTKSIGRVMQACEDQNRDPNSLVYSAAVNVDIRANTADMVVEDLAQFRDAGAQRLYLRFLDTASTEQVASIAVCSNWDWHLDRAMAQAGLDGLVDVMVTSAQAGARKPHPRIFERTLEKCRVTDPAEVVFVGDSWGPDVEGPSAMGMRPVHV